MRVGGEEDLLSTNSARACSRLTLADRNFFDAALCAASDAWWKSIHVLEKISRCLISYMVGLVCHYTSIWFGMCRDIDSAAGLVVHCFGN